MIAAAQAEKEKTPPPATESGAEHISELVGGVLTPKAHSFFPYFDSVYSGGGFTLGAGYGWLYGDHSNAAIRGLYSIKNYKLIEAITTSSQHLDGKLTVGALAGWRDAPEAAFYGLGMDTALNDRANFDLSEGYGDVTAALRPTDWTLLAGSVGVEGYTIESGKGEEPSIEEVYTPATAPGLGAEPDLPALAGAPAASTRARRPGYARKGGLYDVTLHDYGDTNGIYSFDRVDADARPARARSCARTGSSRSAADCRRRSTTTISCRTSCCRRSAAAARCAAISSWRFRDRHSAADVRRVPLDSEPAGHRHGDLLRRRQGREPSATISVSIGLEQRLWASASGSHGRPRRRSGSSWPRAAKAGTSSFAGARHSDDARDIPRRRLRSRSSPCSAMAALARARRPRRGPRSSTTTIRCRASPRRRTPRRSQPWDIDLFSDLALNLFARPGDPAPNVRAQQHQHDRRGAGLELVHQPHLRARPLTIDEVGARPASPDRARRPAAGR